MKRICSRSLREDAFRGSVRQLVRLGDGLAGDVAVVGIEPVALTGFSPPFCPARAMVNGSVTLLSAKVDVRATAAGMLATQ